jgi:hypothetical protein
VQLDCGETKSVKLKKVSHLFRQLSLSDLGRPSPKPNILTLFLEPFPKIDINPILKKALSIKSTATSTLYQAASAS